MIRKPTNELSIRPKMSIRRKFLIMAGISLTFGLALYLAYLYGMKSGHLEYRKDTALINQLNSSISTLRQDLSKVEESLTFAQRQHQIQEEAYKQISKAYANSEQKNRVLGSRLDFYRSIISPEDGQAGPVIQALDHSYDGKALMFDVTLVQSIKHKHEVRGNLKITLLQGDTPIGQWPLSSPRSISYQYFERVSGSMEIAELPDDARIKVELALQDGNVLERWFTLAAIISETE